MQLGHEPGDKCYNPKTAFADDFVVLDVDRIRLVAESSERGRRKVVWSETRGGTVVVGNVV